MNGRAAALTAVTVLMIGAAGCGSSDKDAAGNPAATGAKDASTLNLPRLDGQNLQVAGVWTGAEQKNFLKVLARFDKLTGAKTTFVPTGDNVSTFVGSKIQGGAPPDITYCRRRPPSRSRAPPAENIDTLPGRAPLSPARSRLSTTPRVSRCRAGCGRGGTRGRSR